MKKLYLDTNVVLDYLLDRQPLSVAAEELLQAAELGRAQLFVSSLTYTTAHYIVSKAVGKLAATQALRSLFHLVKTVPVDAHTVGQALQANLPDFEDAVQLFAAIEAGTEIIVTSDRRGFPTDKITVLDPLAALATL